VDETVGTLAPSPADSRHPEGTPLTVSPVDQVPTRAPSHKTATTGPTASPSQDSTQYDNLTTPPSLGTIGPKVTSSPTLIVSTTFPVPTSTTSSNPTDTGDDPLFTNRDEDHRQRGPLIVTDQSGNKLSAATIAGVTLGASALCIIGLVSSRRLFRRDPGNDEEDYHS
jgi:hypothetical protein